MKHINWGIIGCGDVTEVKSGPAFNKVSNSSLVAVMRRDGAKARDYAERHQVPKWYDDADLLINDPEVNAVYIATPPSSHEEYAVKVLAAGKHMYIEKPMTTDTRSAGRIADAVKQSASKASVAHYRRQQPLFIKVKQLLEAGAIGEVRLVTLQLYKKLLSPEQISQPANLWRLNKHISGGGLFYDLAPHQLDLMYYFFGDVEQLSGYSLNQSKTYAADDVTAGTILFKSGVLMTGSWCFNAAPMAEKDYCEIIGSEGKISFSIFDQNPITITTDAGLETINFDPLKHVQQPMIGKVVEYFLGTASNPCSVDEGLAIIKMIQGFSNGATS